LGGKALESRAIRRSCVPLSQSKRNYADGEKEKEVECASKKMRFNGGVELCFHFFNPLEVIFGMLVVALFLLETAAKCQDFLMLFVK
jgi:hypothetical protein